MHDIKGNVNFTLFQSSSDNSSVQSSTGARDPVHVSSRAGRRGTFVPDISSERVRQVFNCFGRVLCFNLSSMHEKCITILVLQASSTVRGSSNRRNLKTLALRFILDSKHFKYGYK